MSISLDPSGNLFIVDTGNNRIRRVDAKTHVITTVAGNGVLGGLVDKGATATGLYQPVSVAVDGNENLYIGGSHFVSVARVDAITRIITKVVGAGLPGDPMAEVPAPGPFWLAVDERGSIWFSDPNQSTVSRVKVDESPHTFAGGAVCGFGGDGGPANGALLCFPEGLSVRNQELYIADTGNNRIRKVDLRTGIITTVAGTGEPGYAGDGGPAVNANLNGPMGVTVDGLGNLYIADTGNNCIRRLDAQTGVVTTWVTARQLDRSVLRRA